MIDISTVNGIINQLITRARGHHLVYNNVIHVYYMDRFIASSNWVVWAKNCEDSTSDLVGEFEDDWMIRKWVNM